MTETPFHYRGGIEPIKFIQSHGLNFAEGSVVKYIVRYKAKGSAVEDLKKARHYIDILLKSYGQ
jgi:hypothetical protein